jgi:D-glycero-D-manno-heptose 1,7-bisphosphate phosphatase
MKLVILDRDGTINADSDDYIKSPEEWEPLPGALQAIASLNHSGWRVVVASNQSGIGRGMFDTTALNAMHDKLHRQLASHGGKIDAIFYCPHTPEDRCDCRKPAHGLFTQIGERFGVDLTGVPAVGDSLRDVQAAQAAGCELHAVKTGKAKQLLANGLPETWPSQTVVHEDLSAFAQYLIGREGPSA